MFDPENRSQIQEQLPFAPKSITPECAEFLKIISNSKNLSADFRAMRESGLLKKVSPRFADLWGKRGHQDPKWHPEGDTFQHTCMVLDKLPPEASLVLRLAAVFHDIGKPKQYKYYPSTGGISNKGHAPAGAKIFKNELAQKFGLSEEDNTTIFDLIRWHMHMHDIDTWNSELLEFFTNHPQLELMMHLQHADAHGTTQSEEARNARSKKAVFQEILDNR